LVLGLLACCPAATGAADLLPGRLFHTPAQRAELDRLRAAETGPTRPAAPRLARPRSAPERSPELSGFVLRSDGRDSFWLTPGTVAIPAPR
jgi:hypothetical protein